MPRMGVSFPRPAGFSSVAGGNPMEDMDSCLRGNDDCYCAGMTICYVQPSSFVSIVMSAFSTRDTGQPVFAASAYF